MQCTLWHAGGGIYKMHHNIAVNSEFNGLKHYNHKNSSTQRKSTVADAENRHCEKQFNFKCYCRWISILPWTHAANETG